MGVRALNAAELLDRAAAIGLEIFLAGNRVKVRAPQQPPDDLLAELRQHKAEMMALLDFRPRQHVYRFRLIGNEGGGLYITGEPSLDRARDCLLMRYGDRLALVVLA